MPVTIKDIAQAAGVSPSTVSRALSDHPRISAGTKERVRQLARDMGYTPSVLARGLVTRHTATIGVVVTTVSDPFLAPLVRGIEEVAYGDGYSVFISNAHRDRERELEVVQSFYERRVSGIIVAGSQIDQEYLELCDRFPLPIVLFNCRTYPYSVSTDNVLGARWAVEHLLQLGHRRIVYIANQRSRRANLDRLAGYQQMLAEGETPADQSLVIESDGTMQGGAEAVQELLALPQPPTAFFCFNDMTAMGVIHALRQAGVRVPQDKSVVGFDDLDLLTYFSPPLTTVRQPTYRLGRRAIQILLALIQGQQGLRPEILPAELVVRETTGPAPALTH